MLNQNVSPFKFFVIQSPKPSNGWLHLQYPRKILLSRTISRWVLRPLARTKASLTDPLIILLLWMIAYGRAWVGDHCMDKCIAHCEPHDALITYCVYAYLDMRMHLWITTPCLFEYMVETYGYGLTADDEYVWGRVSTTVGVGLRSGAIVVIDLSRQDYSWLRIVVVVPSHLTFVLTTTRPCMGRVEANPPGYFGAVQWVTAGQARWHAPNHHRGQLRAARGETRVTAARSPGSSLCWLPDPCPSVSRGNTSCRRYFLSSSFAEGSPTKAEPNYQPCTADRAARNNLLINCTLRLELQVPEPGNAPPHETPHLPWSPSEFQATPPLLVFYRRANREIPPRW